jgi:hypothetical protein
MRAFLSHITEEARAARTLKEQLERAIPGAEVFVSAVDVRLGDAWLTEIDQALTGARAVLVLCSPRSASRPWVNFESGRGWSRERPVIPVCHAGLRERDLPWPLRIFQALELESGQDCEKLAGRLASALNLEVAAAFDFDAMAVAVGAGPQRESGRIGIVLTHGQDGWDARPGTVFDLHRALPGGLQGPWSFSALSAQKSLEGDALWQCAGLILGSPRKQKLEAEVVDLLYEWVQGGGRMLALGFEFGDRHHEANLGDLLRRFGIHPMADIVGPPGCGKDKPYGKPVDFNVALGDPHPLTRGLTTIRLTDVQTMHVEPGGTEWLRVGTNEVYRPVRDTVVYHDGTLAQAGRRDVGSVGNAGWVPVAVEAPVGLCGRGGVHAIGTWDLFGRYQPFNNPDNLTLIQRLLDWLGGK